MIPLIGFTPDIDATTPGVITDCVQLIPYESGMKAAPSGAIPNGVGPLASACAGASVLTNLSGTRRVLAGTATKLYELVSTTWTDQTRVTALATPGIATGTGSATGGTLAAATYYVKIVAIDASGNATPAGPESAGVAVTGTTSSIAYTWAAVASAASYRIHYGTAAGAETAYYTSASASFTLTATSGTAGSPPTSGAISYTLGADSRWSFAQFGDTTIAANGTDLMQRSTSGVFADIAGSPRAEVVMSIAGFVMAFNFNDGTITPDGWICSALYDETSWTPSISTQCTKGRLVSAEGRLTAGKRLGSYAIAYKSKAIYVGQYVGAPVVWQWDQVIGGDAGCIGKDALVDVGGAHYFVNDENFWMFDGTRPVPIATNQVRKWWLSKSDPTYRYRTIAAHDKQNNLVWFYYCSLGSGGVRDSAIVYHLLTKQWGRANRSIEAAMSYISPGVTINGMDAYSATIDGLPPMGSDSQFWLAGGRSLAIVDTAHQVRQMTGPAENSSLTTGDFGDDEQVSMLRKLRPRFAKSPTTAAVQFFKKFNEGDDLVVGQSGTITDGHFQATQRGRWHRARMDFTGEMSITGYQPELAANGKR